MAQGRDFYKVLGVAESASQSEIKKAYRRLAKKYHPDATGGDKAKEAKFKEISEAWETLGDDKKRAQYDELRKNPFAGGGFPGGGPGGPGPGGGARWNVDLNDLFSQFGAGAAGGGAGPGSGPAGGAGRSYTYSYGDGDGGSFGDVFEMFRGGGAGAGRAQRGRPSRGQDAVAKLDIELPEAALGAEKGIAVDGRQLKVKIPAGVTDGKTIRLAGQGEAGARGGQAGDLLIELHVKPHPRFRRLAAPADIEVDLPVPLDVAILGGKADVPTLEGSTVTVTVPAQSSSGRKLRLRGKGAATSPGGARGDLYAVVSVQVPATLSPRARELLTELGRALREDVADG